MFRRRRPLYEGVDWNPIDLGNGIKLSVALFTMAWIEMVSKPNAVLQMRRRPLYEGVDWNNPTVSVFFLALCRPLYEGVDWNKLYQIIYFFV